MKKIRKCEFNMDTSCVEMIFYGAVRMIAVDAIAVENAAADDVYQRSELDWKTDSARVVSPKIDYLSDL